MERIPLLVEGCSATCSSLPLPKPVGFLPAMRFPDLKFENIYMACPTCFPLQPRNCSSSNSSCCGDVVVGVFVPQNSNISFPFATCKLIYRQ